METEIEAKKKEIEELTKKIQKMTCDYDELSQYVVQNQKQKEELLERFPPTVMDVQQVILQKSVEDSL